jgi:beta-galactosidase GanA
MKALTLSSLLALPALPLLSQSPMPELKRNGAVTQMYFEGKPFVMLAGELHNSSASSTAYMKPIWNRLAALNLNTVIGTVSWELLEPEEGKFDYTLVDAQIEEARRRNMRLVLIWFATWKNATSTYAPLWVKTDTRRFPRVETKPRPDLQSRLSAFFASQMPLPNLSAFGEETLAADIKAFRALMRHIRAVDLPHTVIMMQVENEAGLPGDSRDRSRLAEAAWSRPVPAELMDYIIQNKANLLPEMLEVWGAQGFKTSGTWAEVFGDGNYGDEVFQAWHLGRYMGKVIEAGKAELPLPMYVNAWLGPQPGMEQPGQYPSGGPVARVMDVWRAAAPAAGLFAPDIYVQDFKGTCALYARSGNPLFIPEMRGIAGNVFWALGRHGAMGVSPFGIEDVAEDSDLAEAYKVLGSMSAIIAKAQAEQKILSVLIDGDAPETGSLAGYQGA